MAKWSVSQLLSPDIKLSTECQPTLVPFLGDLWCFWGNSVTGAIQYAKSQDLKWATATSAKDTKGEDILALGLKNANFTIAAAVVENTLHLIYTELASLKNGFKSVAVSHLQYVTETGQWLKHAGPTNAAIIGGLGLVATQGVLRAVWCEKGSKRMTSTCTGEPNTKVTWTSPRPLEALAAASDGTMAVAKIGLTQKLFIYSKTAPSKLLGFTIDP